MKYRAIWEVQGKRYIVFPKSRKTSFFRSAESAAVALEKRARRYPENTRGLVEATDGTLALVIAL